MYGLELLDLCEHEEKNGRTLSSSRHHAEDGLLYGEGKYIKCYSAAASKSETVLAVVLSDDTVVVWRERIVQPTSATAADEQQRSVGFHRIDIIGDPSASSSCDVDVLDQQQDSAVAAVAVSENGKHVACLLGSSAVHVVPVGQILGDPDFDASSSQSIGRSSQFHAKGAFSFHVKIREDCLRVPTCALWYQSAITKRPTLIYSNKGGDILLIDLALRKLSVSLQAPQSIHHMEPISDASGDVYLLVTGFAGTQWLVPLETEGRTVRETLGCVVPSDLRELPVGGGSVASVISHGTPCLAVLNQDKNSLQIFHTVALKTAAVEMHLLDSCWSYHFADSIIFALRDRNELVCSVNFSTPLTEVFPFAASSLATSSELHYSIATLPECRFLGFVQIKHKQLHCSTSSDFDCTAWLPECLAVCEYGVYRIQPQITMLHLFLRCLESAVADDNASAPMDWTRAKCLCSTFRIPYAAVCSAAAEHLLSSKSTGNANNLAEKALQLCHQAKMPLCDIADLFEAHGLSSFILPKLLLVVQTTEEVGPDQFVIGNRVVRYYMQEMEKADSENERNATRNEFRDFLSRYSMGYDQPLCLQQLFSKRWWFAVSCLLSDCNKTATVSNICSTALECFLLSTDWPLKDRHFIEALTAEPFRQYLADNRGHKTVKKFYEQLLQFVHKLKKLEYLTLLAKFTDLDVAKDSLLDTKWTNGVGHMDADTASSNLQLACLVNILCLIRCVFDQTLDVEKDPVSPFKASSASSFAVKLSCGANHSIATATDGVYIWGRCCAKQRTFAVGVKAKASPRTSNDGQSIPESGRNGGTAADVPATPSKVKMPREIGNAKVVSVAAGAEHSLLLTSTGQVLAFGDNRYGQLGVGHRDIVVNPMPVVECMHNGTAAAEKVRSIHCGSYHSALVTVNGSVITWGWNLHGQLGVANRIGLEDGLAPVKVTALPYLVHAASLGYAHTVFLTEHGQVFTCGNNNYGQLGTGGDDLSKRSLPVPLDACQFDDQDIIQIATGLFHSIALTSAGSLYQWGSTPQALKFRAMLQKRRNATDRKGQEGSSGADTVPTASSDEGSSTMPTEGIAPPPDGAHRRPTAIELAHSLISGSEHVMELSCGLYHSALITNTGRLYTWGKNLEYQLFHGDKKPRDSPTAVLSTQDIRQWRHVSCGSEYTMAIDRRGAIWGCGRNDLLQLGFDATAGIKGSPAKLGAKTLTIARPNNKGTRTITLPASNRSSVANPTQLRSIRVAADDARTTEQFTEETVIACLLKNAAVVDVDVIAPFCSQYGASQLAPLVWLLASNFSMAVRSLKDVRGSLTETLGEKLTELFERFIRNVPKFGQKLSAFRIFANDLPVDPEIVDRVLWDNLDHWYFVVAHFLLKEPNAVAKLSRGIKLASIRQFAEHRRKQTNCETGSYFADIAHKSAENAESTVYYYGQCGHSMSDRAVQAQLGEMQSRHLVNTSLPTAARLAQQLYNTTTDNLTNGGSTSDSAQSATSAVTRLSSDLMCPECLDKTLSNIAGEVVL